MKDWHEWRAQGIGASDASVIMKKFPYGKTPYMLWNERVNGIKLKENEAMSHGKNMEPLALSFFERKMNLSMGSNIRAEHPKMNWMRATLDGITEDGKILVEIKSPYNLENHEKVKRSGKVPDIYFDQVQHQMKVMELNHMYFLSYNHKDEKDSVIIEVNRDDSYIDKMVKEEYEFFQKIINLTPPDLTQLDYRERGDDWIRIAKERCDLKEQLNALKKKDEELCRELIDYSEGINSCGRNYRFTKYIEDGRIDYKTLLDDFIATLTISFPDAKLPSIDLDAYRKSPITKWRLTEQRS